MDGSIRKILMEYGLSIDSEVFEITIGLINKTYLVHDIVSKTKYILQNINTRVFPDIHGLMNNVSIVNAHINGTSIYRTPIFFKTLKGKDFFTDSKDQSWRLIEFINDSKTINATDNPTIAREAGRAIGKFHSVLSTLDATKLSQTIPDFHDLDVRASQLAEAEKGYDRVPDNMLNDVRSKIDQYKSKFTSLKNIEIPVRVTHNDTKLNNILFDNQNNAICLIDLDTLMPGHVHTDYGDALRTLANSVSEDEKDISKVYFDMTLYKFFHEGFMSEMDSLLTKEEKMILPLSIPFMPYIMAVRFLTDYLNGNTYYKVDYATQNLDRARNQLALVKNIFSRFEEINTVSNC